MNGHPRRCAWRDGGTEPAYAIAGSASVLVSGLLWAVAYERTRSLLPGLFAHAVNNLLSTLWTVGLLR